MALGFRIRTGWPPGVVRSACGLTALSASFSSLLLDVRRVHRREHVGPGAGLVRDGPDAVEHAAELPEQLGPRTAVDDRARPEAPADGGIVFIADPSMKSIKAAIRLTATPTSPPPHLSHATRRHIDTDTARRMQRLFAVKNTHGMTDWQPKNGIGDHAPFVRTYVPRNILHRLDSHASQRSSADRH